MAVELFASPTHKAVVFSYNSEGEDEGVHGDTITVTAQNLKTGDVGSRTAENNGTFVLFYPFDFTGTDHIVVTGSDDGTEEGDVTIT